MASSQSHYKAQLKDGATIIRDQGNNKLTIKPRALDIIWGNDRRYWRLPDKDEGPAELLQVCWLEVSGSIPIGKLQGSGTYELKFEVSMKPDAFGWNTSPVYLMAKVGGKGKLIWKNANLSGKGSESFVIPDDLKFTLTEPIAPEDKISFGLYEIWKGRWKGGLVIHQVLISKI